MAIIGISCFYHDSAVSLISNEGEILAAAQEERFSRIKHDSNFPFNALDYCLKISKEMKIEVKEASSFSCCFSLLSFAFSKKCDSMHGCCWRMVNYNNMARAWR